MSSSSGGQISVEIVAVDKFSQPMGTVGQKAQQLGQSASSATSGVQKLDQSLGAVGKNAGTASTGLEKTNQATQKLGQGAQTAQQSHRNLGVTLAGIGTSAVGLATSVMSLGNTYDNLNDKQIAIAKGATRVEAMQKAVETATIALNKARENEKSTAEEIAVKEKAVEIAKQRLTNTMATQQNLIEDTGRAWQQFGIQIAGTVLQSVGGLTTAFSAMGPAGKAAGQGLGLAGKGAGGLLKSLGPIAITIAALSAAFLAIKNNTFGFRDALNELGLKLGTAVPVFKPILDFLKQLGGFLGIAGDESAVLKDKFLANILAIKDQALAAFNFILDGVKGFVDQMLKAFDEFGKGNWAAGFEIIKQAFLNIINNETLQQFVKTVVDWVSNPSNWQAVGTGIISVFQGLIAWTVNDVAPMVESFVQSIVDFVTDVNNWQALWDGLVQAWTDMLDWASVIADWILPFIEALVDWFSDPSNWEDLWDALVEAWSDLEQWWEDVAKPWMEGILKALTDWAGKPENWTDLGEEIAKRIGEAVKFTADLVAPVVNSFLDAVREQQAKTPPETQAEIGRQQVHGWIDGFLTAIGELSEEIGKLWTGFINAIFGGGAEGGGGAWVGGKEIENEAQINSAADSFWKKLIDIFSYNLQTNIQGIELLRQDAVKFILTGWDALVAQRGAEINAFNQAIVTEITNGFPTVAPQLQTIGMEIINEITAGITNWLSILQTVGGQIFTAFKQGWDTIVPQFQPEGERPIVALWEGILAAIESIKDLPNTILTYFKEGMNTIVPEFKPEGERPIVALWEGILAAIESIKDLPQTIYTYFKEGWDALTTNWESDGEVMIVSLWNGILAAAESIKDLPNTIWTFFNEGLPKMLADFMAAGGKIMENIKKGVEEAIEMVKTALWAPIKWFLDEINKLQPIDLIGKLFGGGQSELKVPTQPGGGTSTMQAPTGELRGAPKEGFVGPQFQAGVGGAQIQNVAMVGTQAEQALSPIQEIVLQLGALKAALELVTVAVTNYITQMTLMNTALQASATVFYAWAAGINTVLVPLSELIVAFFQESVVPNITLMNTALQANMTVWIAWGTGINTILVPLSELIVAFCQESITPNLQLISTGLQANMTVWIAWGGGINTILQPLAELWVAFVNESVIANLTLMQEALLTNFNEGWLVWATKVGEAIVLIGEGLAMFIDDVFKTFNDEIVAGLDAQVDSWLTWAEKSGGALVLIGKGMDQFYNNVFSSWNEGIIGDLETQAEAWEQWADTAVSAIDSIVSSLEDLVQQVEEAIGVVEDLGQAIEDLPDRKEIEVYVGLTGPGKDYLRTGGGFLTVNGQQLGFQGGGSFISTHPMNFRGANISEHGKWELVTVTPLSNPAIGSDKYSKVVAPPVYVPAPIQPQVPAMPAMGGAGSNRPIIVQGMISNILQLPDGRMIAQVANPFMLEGQDSELS